MKRFGCDLSEHELIFSYLSYLYVENERTHIYEYERVILIRTATNIYIADVALWFKRLMLQYINGVSSNFVEGRTKICQLKDLILTLFGLIFRRIYIYLIICSFSIFQDLNKNGFYTQKHIQTKNSLLIIVILYFGSIKLVYPPTF